MMAWDVLRKSPTIRTPDALDTPWWQTVSQAQRPLADRLTDAASQSRRKYFRRRFQEERRAAAQAASQRARRAHAKLANLYARLARDVRPTSPDAGR
jgi:hypothetical protein